MGYSPVAASISDFTQFSPYCTMYHLRTQEKLPTPA
ncbi:unnamed protein product [Musa acuminata subsp. malaccensis]|uniref:Uncharacterized protein n=1 Tax=Musa acuminata subsp. malaccensis TaxID=214687 RepID=A0A804HM94_MUSAM|nr:unnamed protein product [Musa acuminata subsp. malaccensis]